MEEKIYAEANKRYPRRWSGDRENSNNSDKFIEGAEWAFNNICLPLIDNGTLIRECIKRKIYIEPKK